MGGGRRCTGDSDPVQFVEGHAGHADVDGFEGVARRRCSTVTCLIDIE